MTHRSPCGGCRSNHGDPLHRPPPEPPRPLPCHISIPIRFVRIREVFSSSSVLSLFFFFIGLYMSSLEGNPPASGSDSSCDDEFSSASAVGTYTGPSWSDLPIDVLLGILQYLEVPQRVVFASVCTTWKLAAAVNGVPRSIVPWFMSWGDHMKEKKTVHGGRRRTLTCSFHHLLDINKTYDVSFPRGCFVACCGASHGWLVLVNELCNLVLYNPFTMAMIDLPPVTDFSCVEAIYGDSGILEHCILSKKRVHETSYLGRWFYQKAVLSCSPSKHGAYVVMIIHRDRDWLSFVKAGQSKWQVASTLPARGKDRYADCAYHGGRFYSVTLHGMVEEWDLDELNGPTRKIIVAAGHLGRTLTRHLVSTAWGDLLRVRLISAPECPDGVRFQIQRIDYDGCKKVMYTDLMDHAIFLGLNHSSCLATKSFTGLQPHRIYFSAPCMGQTLDWPCRISRVLGGVGTYDLKSTRFERASPLTDDKKGWISPSEVWITPNL
ncbi:hypothetical protein EJB05_38385 [Eragrostis curvula]|uniref:F-box domain-containing protein n=1 Tax=Eragrostis curvula TaxID=38414 RepID=A0A5J9TVR1_9POAL|nr:hypothetical protein EJB05_38385 [Eragrostis curvula]